MGYRRVRSLKDGITERVRKQQRRRRRQQLVPGDVSEHQLRQKSCVASQLSLDENWCAMPKRSTDVFARWGKRVNWKRRVKAVCKPCWELKFCPYGPLVERFPLRAELDSRSCRIFGHDCPVFHVAEPFTETKELRNISRSIPRPVQFRVLKRENQICAACGKSVQDGDIHFDHVIPFSKGGSSDERNIRLLCGACNLKRSNRFESEYLVANSSEHLQEHLDLGFLDLVLDVCAFAHAHRKEHREFPGAKELSDEFHDGSVDRFEEAIAKTVVDLNQFFSSSRPDKLTAKQMRGLRKRWGYSDGRIYDLKAIATEFGEEVTTLVLIERAMLSRAGWYLKEDKYTRRRWQDK